MFLEVSILSPGQVIFRGRATSIILPGEQGTFEIAPFHKRTLSRLLSGKIFLDDKIIQIRRGIVKVSHNKVTILVEEV